MTFVYSIGRKIVSLSPECQSVCHWAGHTPTYDSLKTLSESRVDYSSLAEKMPDHAPFEDRPAEAAPLKAPSDGVAIEALRLPIIWSTHYLHAMPLASVELRVVNHLGGDVRLLASSFEATERTVEHRGVSAAGESAWANLPSRGHGEDEQAVLPNPYNWLVLKDGRSIAAAHESLFLAWPATPQVANEDYRCKWLFNLAYTQDGKHYQRPVTVTLLAHWDGTLFRITEAHAEHGAIAPLEIKPAQTAKH